jgi:hypothetical protein
LKAVVQLIRARNKKSWLNSISGHGESNSFNCSNFRVSVHMKCSGAPRTTSASYPHLLKLLTKIIYWGREVKTWSDISELNLNFLEIALIVGITETPLRWCRESTRWAAVFIQELAYNWLCQPRWFELLNCTCETPKKKNRKKKMTIIRHWRMIVMACSATSFSSQTPAHQ